MLTLDEIRALSDADLATLFSLVAGEQQARSAVANAQKSIEDIQTEVLNSSNRFSGQPWVQPQGAHDAYPLGWKVTHQNRVWKSLIAANTTEPGSDPRWWDDITVTPPGGGGLTGWVAGKAYAVNGLVVHQTKTYRCIQAHTSQVGWEPPNVPSLWREVT